MFHNLLFSPKLIRQSDGRDGDVKTIERGKKPLQGFNRKPKVEGTTWKKDMVVDKMLLQFLTTLSLRKFSCYLLNQNLDNIAHRNH